MILGLESKINILEMNIAKMPKVKHITLQDANCTINQNGLDVGFCPDEIDSTFIIEDEDFILDKSVLFAQVTNPTDPIIHKVVRCDLRVVFVYPNSTNAVDLICEAPPLENSVLSYTLTNP